MTFLDRLKKAWRTQKSQVCVGLDPIRERFPKSVLEREQSIFEFNKSIIDATAEFACAFKPQFAHYAAVRAEGELEKTFLYIKENYPEHICILDSKRGDIGTTAEMYAKESFDRYQADAVTVNPYMGEDTISPFSTDESRGVFLLCRTSNPSASEVQGLMIGEQSVYEKVAELTANQWNKNKNLGLVLGATGPEQMKQARSLVGDDVPFLVPGVGAQGGSVREAVEGGKNSEGEGLLINSSRGIIYASSGDDFADAARAEAQNLRDEIRKYV